MEIVRLACGKTNDLETTPACARCGCNLAALGRILMGAGWHLQAAGHALRTGDWETALAEAERSWDLRHSAAATRAACVAAIALGDSDEVAEWRLRTVASATGPAATSSNPQPFAPRL
jgi:hypothetical protein